MAIVLKSDNSLYVFGCFFVVSEPKESKLYSNHIYPESI